MWLYLKARLIQFESDNFVGRKKLQVLRLMYKLNQLSASFPKFENSYIVSILSISSKPDPLETVIHFSDPFLKPQTLVSVSTWHHAAVVVLVLEVEVEVLRPQLQAVQFLAVEAAARQGSASGAAGEEVPQSPAPKAVAHPGQAVKVAGLEAPAPSPNTSTSPSQAQSTQKTQSIILRQVYHQDLTLSATSSWVRAENRPRNPKPTILAWTTMFSEV